MSEPDAIGPPTLQALASLRHDLRTLLNPVLGYTALWLEDSPADADPSLARRLAGIHDLGQALLARISELLAAPRLEDPSYRAAVPGALRAALDAPAREVTARAAALRADCAAAPGDLVADLRRVETAGQGLLAMLDGIEHRGGGAAAAEAPPAEPGAGPARMPGGNRVLVVDDNAVNRDVLSRWLERAGQAVSAAADGALALAMLEREPYDLVALDIVMPEMDGYETLRRIRADSRWDDVPVLMISSLDEMASVIRCIELGAEDYLPKPFDPVLLRARVGACLEKKRLRDERAARQKAEQARLKREFEKSARVQQRLLPQPAPEVPGLDLAGHCLPARAVGGDYFDFLPLGDGRLGVVVADVAGKGMPAALVMASVAASLRSQVHRFGDEIARLVESLNGQLCEWTDAGEFVTLFYGCLDVPRRRLRYVNAGHTLPLLARGADGSVTRLPDVGGLVLGVRPDASFEVGSVDLQAGDALLAFTDGVTEAFNETEEGFGDERLEAVFSRHASSPASDILAAVRTAAVEWCGAEPQSDDLTLLVMKLV